MDRHHVFAALLTAFGTTPAFAQAAPITAPAPVIFAPGVVSGPANDGAPAFTPDGKTLYFERTGASWGFILESHLVNGHWTAPAIAPFSGLWSDSQPALSPDGATLVFQSWRPRTVDAAARPSSAPAIRTSALWVMHHTARGWSEPAVLPITVNITGRVFKPAIAANGNIYFMSRSDSTPTWRLYRSKFVNGSYQQAEPLSFSDGKHGDVDPGVAPDESFLVFSSNTRAGDGDSHEHLYITFRTGDAWGPIVPLRYEGDYEKNPADDGEAQLSPDHRTLYFTSGRVVPIHASRSAAQAKEDWRRLNQYDNGNSNAWSISLAPWLDAKRGE